MSKIAIQVAAATDEVRTIAALRSVHPDTSIAEFRSRIAAGAPVVESILFGNNYVEVAARLLAIVQAVPATGATVRIFLLREEETFEEIDQGAREITVEVLRNMLASVDEYE